MGWERTGEAYTDYSKREPFQTSPSERFANGGMGLFHTLCGFSHKTGIFNFKVLERNYLKGKRSRNKPTIKKKFVKIKETLYTYRDGKLKVSIKPYEDYLEFDISKAWFSSRA
ncbi:MAG: hypothetical protein ACUVQ8_03460 [Nitrososphaeria archaeon]